MHYRSHHITPPLTLLTGLLLALSVGFTCLGQGVSVRPKAPLTYLAKDLGTLRSNFAKPPQEAGPWVYWFWFGNVVKREEITRELEEMAEKGIAGVELRCITMYGFPGGKPGAGYTPAEWEKIGHKRYEYLSPEHVAILGHTLAEAKRLGLKFSLNMGMGWPPGGRWITNRHRSVHLLTDTLVARGNSLFTHTIDTTKTLSVEAMAWRIKRDREVDQASAIDLKANINPAGQLAWQVPRGDWLVGIFRTTGGGRVDKGEGWELDPASEEAVRFHLDELFGRMEPVLKPYFGNTLTDMATDSWEYIKNNKGRYWSPVLVTASPKQLGYSLKNRLYALLGYGPDREKVLRDLEHLEKEVVYQNYFQTVKTYLDARGINHRPQIYGRGLERDLFETYALADIPEMEEGVYLPDAVWTAHLLNKPIISCESFTHTSIRGVNLNYGGQRGEFSAVTKPEDMWKTTPALLKGLMNAHYGRGTNRVQMHSFSYSPPEIPYPGWRMYAEAHINRLSPFWGQFKELNTWVARTQYVLQSGEPVTDTFVYPVEQNLIDGPFNSSTKQPVTAINAIDAASPQLLARMVQQVDKLNGRIKHVVVKENVKTIAEAQQLAKLLQTGAVMHCLAGMPTNWSAFKNEPGKVGEKLKNELSAAAAKGRVVDATGKDWSAVARENASVRWQPVEAKLSFQQRRIAGGTVYLLTSWEDGFEGDVSFPPSDTAPEQWDANTGSIKSLPHRTESKRCLIRLAMGSNESMIVVFSNKTATR